VILIVKSPSALFIAAALALALTGCGQTGPLYMPKPPAKPATPPATVVTAPAPSLNPPSVPAQ
jgi:predicted small lipoprotein YifL